MKFILGKKLEMSQVFDSEGNVIPVTLILAGPCHVTQIKTKEKDGYDAVQFGFQEIIKEKNIKKPQASKPFKHLKELSNIGQEFKVDQKIDVSVFEEGEKISVSGLTKGKGFQGGVKRWGFHGRNATRGAKHEERTIGSTGSRYPQRVIKGRRMPGRMGGNRKSVKSLEVVRVDKENNLLAVKGAVPGRKGTLLEIKGK